MKVKIGNQNWTIEEVDGADSRLVVNDTCCLGVTYYKEQKIYLCHGMEEDGKRQTLGHELAHAFIYATQVGNKENYTHEELCDFVGIYQDDIHKIVDDYFKE